MGMYVNPPGGDKRAWLETNGTRISETDAQSVFADGDSLPVCLVDNGPFTAAGIGFSADEIDVFSDPRDDRNRVWFAVPRPLLEPFM